MKKIRIGQYGIGHNHGEEKMKSFRRFPELFEVVGVCEPDEKWRAARGALPGYAGLRFLTEEEFFSAGLDAALVETDVPDLDRAAKKCLDHGLHIHMDKPGGEDIAEFTDVVNTARDKGLILQMGYMYRYNPVIRYAIDLAKSGALGEIFEIDTQMSTAHPAAYREWLSRSFRCGTMYIFGCHLIDMIFQVLGTEPEDVVSFIKETLPQDVPLADNALAVLTYPHASCTVRTSSREVNGYGRRQLVICGSEGTVEVKPLEGPSTVSVSFKKDLPPTYKDTRTFLTGFPEQEGRYDEQAKDFYAYVRGEKENPFDYDYEIALQRATLLACGIR
ncbi:MAG: Gfo/Idh/MocA family oxidoreductase [Lachnospiraceae bacterium]|nr:Gfo/Idh/MocA family oxidoreductase [Lachnospiraceae bacterium]